MKKLSLAGRKILITRAREQSASFAGRLRRSGADVIEFPTIEILPPLRWNRVDRAIDQLNSYDWIIFTSVNGVDFFLRRMGARGREFPISSCKVAAIGPATKRALTVRGIPVALKPKEFVAEGILRELSKIDLRGKRILLARAKKARDILPEGLKKSGAFVEVVEAYRTVKPKGGSQKLKHLLRAEKIDAVTFTSSSTVNHFVELLKGSDFRGLMRGIAIACIGPVTARAAEDSGMEVRIQPRAYTIPGLVNAIEEYFRGKDTETPSGRLAGC